MTKEMPAPRRKRWTKGSPFPGIWRITKSGDLEEDHLHLLGPAAIEFKKGHLGDLRFGALEAQLDWRADGCSIEFTFQGFEEGDEVCGRGKASVGEDGVLRGRLLYFLGDEFSFEAERA